MFFIFILYYIIGVCMTFLYSTYLVDHKYNSNILVWCVGPFIWPIIIIYLFIKIFVDHE